MQLTALLGDEQRLIFEHAAAFLRGQMMAAGAERSAEAIAALWDETARLQWLTVCLPPTAPDSPNFRTACSLAEAIGYTGAPVPFVAAALAGWLLQELATSAWARELLAAQIEGRSLTVSVLGDDEASITYAVAEGAHHLSGWTPLVQFAPLAHRLLVAACGPAGGWPAIFLIPTDARGIVVTPQPTSGAQCSAEVRLDGVVAEAPMMQGEAAIRALSRLRLNGAALRAAELAGIGRAALGLTLEYVRHRVQFGRPIGSFQAVQHHCADMLRDLTATRLLVAQAAARLDSDRPAEREVRLAKAKASEAIPALLRAAHQVTGGVGYYADYPLEGYYRRAIDAQASFGNAQQQRRALTRLFWDDLEAFRGPDAHERP